MGLFKPNVERLAENRDVKGLAKALFYKKAWRVREAAAEALGKIGDSQAVEPLIAALKDEDWYVRKYAVEALGKIGESRTVKSLIAALNDLEQDVRKAAVKVLVKIGLPAVELLIAVLKDEDREVRKSAAEALGKIGDSRTVEPLIAALKDEYSSVRREVVEALDKLGWKPDMSEAGVFYWILKGDLSKCVKIGAPAVEPLIAALKDKNNYVHREAAESLGKIGDIRAVEPLIAALKDWDQDVRYVAVEALGKIGDSRAAGPFIAALNDKDWDMRKSAANGLICIYKSGKISNVDKNSILACRSSISEEHHDFPASGSSSHSDVGIGIDFPY